MLNVRGLAIYRTAVRCLLRPPPNSPYRGIYRTEGEVCRRDEILVSQGALNYHPGLNVHLEKDRVDLLLKASCDGVVRITREKITPDFTNPDMKVYEHRRDNDIYKLHFNVIPFEMSKNFTLKSEI
ncbi:unnamed protein product, partial [Mesorhabditis spiculigera]